MSDEAGLANAGEPAPQPPPPRTEDQRELKEHRSPAQQHRPTSSMSTTTSSTTLLDSELGLEDQDEDVRMAVKVLGDMRKGTPTAITTPSTSPTISTAASNTNLVGRVTGLPYVSGALRAYETTKASSQFVKYGAEMVESSLSSVVGRLPALAPERVERIEGFVGRTLDRIDRYRGTEPSPTATTASTSTADKLDSPSDNITKWVSTLPSPHSHPSSLPPSVPSSPKSTKHRRGHHRESSRSHPYSPVLSSSNASSRDPSTSRSLTVQQPRSRWHAVLSEAGGIGAALSEESMKRLGFVLSWLQYATKRIDDRIVRLRDFTESLKPKSPSQPHTENCDATPSSEEGSSAEAANPEPITPDQLATLNALRTDIITTIRQAVDIISKYAGGAESEGGLGGEERRRVKGFILSLPGRWREAMAGAPSPATTPTTAAAQSPRTPTQAGAGPSGRETPTTPTANGGPVAPAHAIHAAQRILTLATESLDMIHNVTGVVKDSLDRANAWVGRFESVGLRGRHGHPGDDNISQYGWDSLPGSRRGSVDTSALREMTLEENGMDVDPEEDK